MKTKVAIVGLGAIGQCHVDALSCLDGIEVIAGADSTPQRELRFHGHNPPVYASTGTLLAAHQPDVLIVATPTSSHLAVCEEIAAHPQRPDQVFVEKPLSGIWDEATTMVEQLGVRCLYHAAYAPEVLWAADRLPSWLVEFGPVTRLEAEFADPYRDRDQEMLAATYGTSWLDSGINALSVSSRLVTLRQAESAAPVAGRFNTYRAEIEFASAGRVGTGRITTSWDVDRAAKTSVATFASGATLHLDHQAVTGRLDTAGQVVDEYSG